MEILCNTLQLPHNCIHEALQLTGLLEFQHRQVKKYSLRMKQRLGLAEALLGRSEILILDEPANELDPTGIHGIRTFIK